LKRSCRIPVRVFNHQLVDAHALGFGSDCRTRIDCLPKQSAQYKAGADAGENRKRPLLHDCPFRAAMRIRKPAPTASSLARFTREHGVLFVVFQIAVTYHQPARLNERLTVSAEVVKMGRARLVFRQRVEREAELLCEADVTLAIVDRERMKPARMPEELAQALT